MAPPRPVGRAGVLLTSGDLPLHPRPAMPAGGRGGLPAACARWAGHPLPWGGGGWGLVPLRLPLGPGWVPGKLPCWNLYLFVFILSSCLPWLSCGAGQLLEKHQGLGMSSRNHLVPTDLTLHCLPVPGQPRAGSGLAGGAGRAGAAFGPRAGGRV